LRDKKARFIFVTLTVRNVKGEELRAKIQEMNEAFKWITQKSKTSAVSKKLKDYVMGYMKAIEVTYNHKTNTFHPHFHIIFELKTTYFTAGYMNQEKWREMWKEVMHLDYDPQVDVRIIKNATSKAVAEVAKYPVKLKGLLEIDPRKAVKPLIQLKKAIQDLRMITYGGDFREYKRILQLDDVENGDLVHIETEKNELNAVALMLYKYRADVGAYIC
ncbi:MAG: protein rep, partial [Candidatus Gastranaerophilales bacterium]|nr:protein rep [Candidatus Gastranaerophilales bacterium]